jgi:3-dehydroquinate synthase
MKMTVHTRQRDYDIEIAHGLLQRVSAFVEPDRRVFILSEDGVPECWRNLLADQFPGAGMFVFPQGEASKNMDTLQDILARMLEHHLTRGDLVLALGGGVTGDLSGLAASLYMRGIDWVSLPTTMLAMVDSSIGGKTAVDFHHLKNSIGTFWQPSLVLIDPDALRTLCPRLLSEGLAEAVKTGMIRDPELFALFESDAYQDHLDEIIWRSLRVKKDIVEADEREGGLRKLLNFGHTFGHAYEELGQGRYLHGECVAMGMMTILENKELKKRLAAVLDRLHLPQSCTVEPAALYRCIESDKKTGHETITIVQVEEMGKGTLETWSLEKMKRKCGL